MKENGLNQPSKNERIVYFEEIKFGKWRNWRSLSVSLSKLLIASDYLWYFTIKFKNLLMIDFKFIDVAYNY